jgi:phosphatidylethanolamine-binding protein (PEBP) family uncharacterized protein
MAPGYRGGAGTRLAASPVGREPIYFEPRPPGSRPHRYHFQFALGDALTLPAGADREALLAAMNGHVLTKADLVGLFGKPRR